MKVLYNWLKEFVDVTAGAPEVRSRLSMAGVAVDAIADSSAGPVLDAEITINRPDCLGHYGVAREVAALYRQRVKTVAPKLREAADRAERVTRVEIECPELCGRFTARVIRGVKVQPSPDWLRQRLEALGQNSINNVVDATNYVMFELGHPLHAFDLDTLAEKRIVVRRARAGEKLRTLDGVERALTPEMCMVADGKRAVGIGGVMGGAETEISSASRNVLVECAWFEPRALRRTSKVLGLRTEASTRFERGMDPEMAELASRRCAELIQQIAGGEILAGVVDVYPVRPAPHKVDFTRKELLRVMGADVPDKEIEAILAALGFAPLRTDAVRGSEGSLMATWECTLPTWRQDVTREIDLVEEVARHYGFDKFPSRLPPARQPAARLRHADAEDRLRERLVALGYHEIVTIPHVDPDLDVIFRPESSGPARLANPLAEDASVLRSTGVVTMAATLEWNLNRGQRDVRLFEIGKVYRLNGAEPAETRVVTIGATGLAREKGAFETPREFSFADLKGDLDRLGELAGGFVWGSGGPGWLHPARAAKIGMGQTNAAGIAGQLARRAAERFKLRQDVYVAEFQLEPFFDAYQTARARRSYQPLSRFPGVERDFSLVVDDSIRFAQAEEAIRGLGIAELASIEAVDLFRGGQIPAGRYSLLVRVTFQSQEGTLTEGQLADFTARIVAVLESKLGATLRVA